MASGRQQIGALEPSPSGRITVAAYGDAWKLGLDGLLKAQGHGRDTLERAVELALAGAQRERDVVLMVEFGYLLDAVRQL